MTGRPLIVLRPEPGLAATLAAARAAGLAASGFASFVAEPRAWDCPDPAGFAGLLLASGTAARLAGPQLGRLRHLPVHAVGEATAAAARAAGMTVAGTGAGGIEALLAALPPARYLRLAGEEHVALAPEQGVETRVVYAMRPRPLPDPLAETLRGGGVVLLHSAAAARHFTGECERLAIDRGRVTLACLGPRIAAAAGVGWQHVAHAPRPDDGALLALAGQLCQMPPRADTDGRRNGNG